MDSFDFFIYSFIVWFIVNSIYKHLFKNSDRLYSSRAHAYICLLLCVSFIILFGIFYTSVFNNETTFMSVLIDLHLDDDTQAIAFIFQLLYDYTAIRHSI